MSGGSFGYFYQKMENFIEDVEKFLEEEQNSGFVSLEGKTEIQKFLKNCREVAEISHALEWFASDDFSEKDFLKVAQENKKSFKP